MSIASWKVEFYPTPAGDFLAWDELPKTGDAATLTLLAAEHALRKWTGLRPNALARHCVQPAVGRRYLRSRFEFDELEISSESCSLCHRFRKPPATNPCWMCPLAALVGGKGRRVGCDEEFSAWARAGDPEPMIRALADLVDILKQGPGAVIEIW